MEPVKLIFESLGCGAIENILKKYLVLTLLLKQLLFSLFSAPVELFDIHSLPAETKQNTGYNEITESSEEDLNRVETFQLLFTLGKIGPEKSSASNETLPNLQ